MTRVTQPMLDVFGYLVGKGLHEKGAAAIVGNFCQESGEGLDATMYRAHPDASGGVRQDLKSGGLAEWLGDRKTKYIEFSQEAEKSRGLSPGLLLNDRFTQCDFTLRELTSDRKYWDLYQQLTTETGRSVATLTANFMEIFERPSNDLNAQGGRIDGLDNRIAHANAIYERSQLIKNAKEAPTVPSAPPAPPTPYVPIPTIPTDLPRPSIPAGDAARQTSVQNAIDAIGANYLDELRAYRIEMNAMIDAAMANFGNLPGKAVHTFVEGIPAPSVAIPKPAATPAAVEPKRNDKVFGITNWQTTITGMVAALMGVAQFVPALAPYTGIINAIGLIAAGGSGMAAKDKNVTGGAISNVDGRTLISPVSIVDDKLKAGGL